MNKKRNPIWPFGRQWLCGIDQIAEFANYKPHEIMDWVAIWIDCPIQKNESEATWFVKKADIKKFIEAKKPPREEVPEIIYVKPKKNHRRY